MKNIFVKITLLLWVMCFIISAEVKATDDLHTSGDTVYIVKIKTHTNVKVVESAKKQLMAKYPDKKFLMQVQPPNYTLSVGYFKTQAEAEEFKKLVEKDYPGCAVLPYEQKK
ncbi:MAG: hypothetical protein K2X86_07555 [Cytophagaceae bacterium]|nr:hypothetical protein [Cytophagaceae bacterium]